MVDQRLDHMTSLEERIRMIEEKTQQIQNITLNTKKDIFDAWTKQKLETLQQSEKLAGYEDRLEQTVDDAKYWLKTYNKTYAEHDSNLQSFRT
jgi:hypothetical protein